MEKYKCKSISAFFRIYFVCLQISFLMYFTSISVAAAATKAEFDMEALILSEFKEMVNPYLYRDFMKRDGYLLRWLTAYEFDPHVAAQKFNEMIKWRIKNDIDTIWEEDFHLIDELMPCSMNGFDKDGRPVVWSPFGSYDLRKITLAGAEKMYQRYVIRAYEVSEFYLTMLDSNITQFVGIYDWNGFSTQRSSCYKCMKMVPEFMTVLESYYPEIYHKWFLINTPKMFESMLSFAKTFLTEKTKSVLAIYGFQKDKWSAALKEQIPLSELSVEYGGIKPTIEFKSKQNFLQVFEKGRKHYEQEFGKIVQRKTFEENEVEKTFEVKARLKTVEKMPVLQEQGIAKEVIPTATTESTSDGPTNHRRNEEIHDKIHIDDFNSHQEHHHHHHYVFPNKTAQEQGKELIPIKIKKSVKKSNTNTFTNNVSSAVPNYVFSIKSHLPWILFTSMFYIYTI